MTGAAFSPTFCFMQLLYFILLFHLNVDLTKSDTPKSNKHKCIN